MTMRWDEGKEEYVLSSGRRIYANLGILGLGPEADGKVTDGHDGHVDGDRHFSRCPFTLEERREIADAMIARWTQWALRVIEP